MEVKVFVDSGTSVSESNESNNQLIKVIAVKGLLPDLKIEALSLNPENPKPGENITFTVTVKNDGSGDASSNVLKYEINGTNEIYSGKIPISSLSAGNTISGTFYWAPGNEGAGLPGSFKNGLIEFKVEKEWIKENNVNQSLITLQWYDKSWRSLYTERVREDRNYIYFKTETPGFSCFAITEYVEDEKNKPEIKEEGRLQETLKNWSDRKTGNLNGSSEDSGLIKNPMEKTKILMAISLPLSMIFVEYFILKKKI